jgi:hypothetical protein
MSHHSHATFKPFAGIFVISDFEIIGFTVDFQLDFLISKPDFCRGGPLYHALAVIDLYIMKMHLPKDTENFSFFTHLPSEYPF